MEKIFNLTSTFKALSDDDDGVHICGMASTSDFDRAGDTIDAEAWTKGGLNNFEKNPIILFNHDYNKPIGRATGLKVTENGLELKAKISKSAPDHVAQLVKEGILGAFSVGFRVKDADYLMETDGLKIKDAELFEVSVVSVPCNQAATFSLAKSFNSMDEYEEFKKTFKNSVDLAGQSLANDEDSLVASDTPDGTDESVQKEINMSEVNTPEIDLDAFARKVAEETAAKIAMKQAEEKAAVEAEAKAAQEAEEAKAAQEETVKQTIRTGIESGADRLMSDMNAKMAEKDADYAKIVAQFEADLKEKNDELTKMRESKRVFSDRKSGNELSALGKELMHGHLLGVMTNKGWNTDYSQQMFQKNGIDYMDEASNIAQEVSRQLEKEIQLELRTAALFREMAVNGKSTVIPLQTDTDEAVWANAGDIDSGSASAKSTSTNVANRGVNAAQFNAKEKIITVDRLISTTYLDNYIDEEVLVNLMPMMAENIARAHARAVDKAIIQGNGGNAFGPGGLDSLAYAMDVGLNNDQPSLSAGEITAITAKHLVGMRREMGVYGLTPQDVVYIISQDVYHSLLNDAEFDNVFEVGSDAALKLVGQVGQVYGSPVVISDNFPAVANAGNAGAFAVNTRNFVIPRLRGVSIEQDYEVVNQRRVLVGTQHLGFNELFNSVQGKAAAVKLSPVAAA
jgi:HK97 family phage prohead protease